MKVLKIEDYFDVKDLLEKIMPYVRNGKSVLMPSDSCYGFLGDSASLEVRDKISDLKRMPKSKKMSLSVADKKMFDDCLEMDLVVAELIEEYLPGALTVLARGNKNCELELNPKVAEHELILKGDFVGVRLPEHNLMRGISEDLGRPVFTTSANVHGMPSCYSLYELEQQMGDSFLDIDLIVDGGVLNYLQPSTIVKVDDNVLQIVRSGLLTDDIMARYKIVD